MSEASLPQRILKKTPLKDYHPLTNAELGVLVGMASFGMLFGTLFLTYLLARARMPVWPPIGVDPIRPGLPTLSTLVILASSYFVQQAANAYELKNNTRARRNWKAAIVFAFGFLVLQCFVWKQLLAIGLRADSNLFGGIFYAMTGIHAVHILGGIAVLFWVYKKVIQKSSDLTPRRQAPRLAAWIWHFLDAIWVLMYFMLIWI